MKMSKKEDAGGVCRMKRDLKMSKREDAGDECIRWEVEDQTKEDE